MWTLLGTAHKKTCALLFAHITLIDSPSSYQRGVKLWNWIIYIRFAALHCKWENDSESRGLTLSILTCSVKCKIFFFTFWQFNSSEVFSFSDLPWTNLAQKISKKKRNRWANEGNSFLVIFSCRPNFFPGCQKQEVNIPWLMAELFSHQQRLRLASNDCRDPLCINTCNTSLNRYTTEILLSVVLQSRPKGSAKRLVGGEHWEKKLSSNE